MGIVLALIGVWVGLLIIPLWFIGISVVLIKQLSDDPKQPNKPYFYTAIEPGRIKAVLRGGRVIRYLMNFAEHKFTRLGDNTSDKHWDVVEGGDTVALLTPVNFHFGKYVFWPFFAMDVFRWCVSVVFRWTGHIFVGVWPFQILHLYRFIRKVQKVDENGHPVTDESGKPVLIDQIETTDHVRARSFVRQGGSQKVETQEGLKVGVTWVADVSTTNPQKALFGSDRWDVVLDSTILRVLAANTRTMPINQVLTAQKGKKKGSEEGVLSTKDKLANDVKIEVNKRLALVGLRLDNFNIIDFEADLSPEDAKALTAKWRAERLKEALKLEGEGRGEGRAAEIIKVAEAIKNGGEEASQAQKLEAQIATAKAVGDGGGVAIFGTQTGTDSTQAAILAELRKLNKGE